MAHRTVAPVPYMLLAASCCLLLLLICTQPSTAQQQNATNAGATDSAPQESTTSGAVVEKDDGITNVDTVEAATTAAGDVGNPNENNNPAQSVDTTLGSSSSSPLMTTTTPPSPPPPSPTTTNPPPITVTTPPEAVPGGEASTAAPTDNSSTPSPPPQVDANLVTTATSVGENNATVSTSTAEPVFAATMATEDATTVVMESDSGTPALSHDVTSEAMTSGKMTTEGVLSITTGKGKERTEGVVPMDVTTSRAEPTSSSTTPAITTSQATMGNPVPEVTTQQEVAGNTTVNTTAMPPPAESSIESTVGALDLTTEPLLTTTTTRVTTEAPGPCAVVPCKNGATCEPSGDRASYTCSCAAGWTGQQCTEDVDECASSPCANGAPCEQGQNYFTCNCLPGYTGTLCDKDIDYCAATPCLNGGTCTDMVAGFTCSCRVGYTGDTCQTDIDDCLSSPCMNNGSCVDGINMYTCDCGLYWTGDLCQEDIDECSLSPIPKCDTRSTCTNSQGGYSCTCPVGYSGDGATCQFIDLCEGNPCTHGVCLSHTLNFTCICDMGWTGPNCKEDINECNATIGVCDATYGDCKNTPGSFRCQCLPGSHGNGVKCIRDTVYELGTNRICHNADTHRSPYPIPGGFPYFGSRYDKVYTSIDGHVSFSPDSLPPNPPNGGTPVFPPEAAMIAPFWTDLDTTSGPGALCVSSYEPGDGSDIFNDINADIRKYVGDVNLTYVVVFTYKEVEPYPSYVSAGSKENATFQLVLATTNEQSFAMFNYNPDGPWLNMDANERRHLIGYSFGNGSAVKIDLLEDTPGFQTNIGHDGRYFFTLGDKMTSPDHSCLTWYRSQRSQGQRSLTPPCPCTLAQAGLDTRYLVNGETGCAETMFADGSGGKQTCCYDSMGALHTGYPFGGYPMIPEDADGRAACCEVTQLCHLFYELRPSDNCRTYLYKPPTWALAWGIGHYQTVNSEQFTFNDRGLFNLFDHSTFTLQGKTDLVPSLLTDLMATALVAVACKTPNSSTVEVSQGPGGGLVMMVDGLAAAPGFYSRVYLSEIGDDTVLVQFADGQAVLVTAVEDVLRVRLSVPEVHPGTKGLFTATPGGTQQQLSQYAAISDDVLFIDKNFSFPGYTPTDLSATIDQLKNRVATNDSEPAAPCDQVVQCLYDFVATDGDIYRAVSAITERTVYLEHRRKLANMAPMFNSALPSVMKVNVSVPIVMNVAAADPEGDHTIYNLSTNINTSDYIFLDSGYFRWVPVDTNTSIYIRFTATDKEGATTIYWPQVRLCDCAVNNIRSCDFGFIDILGSKSNDERFYMAECPCLPGYTGRTCSQVADLCEPNPCYTAPATNSCTTHPGLLPHGVSCAPCPDQLTGDGLRCFDENECMRGTSECSHICVNQPGSYSCTCPGGYQLADNKFTCLDRDECTLGEHNCRGIGEYCSNTPGSYTCQCKGHYYRDNNTCVYARFRSGGQVAYQALQLPSGERLTWSDSLKQKDSDRYKTETTEVEKWCTGYYKDQPGFKDCQVTQLSKGSTIAEYNLYLDQPLNISTAATDFRTHLEAQGCSMSGPACDVGPLVGVDLSRSFPKVKDLCEDEADNDCDAKSTQCSSYINGTFSCSCRTGFKKYLDINTICQDINECEGVNNCSVDTEDCVNTIGGFTCQCKDSYRTHIGKCVPACVPNPCKHKGECFPDVSAAPRYTCRCKGFWSGPDCSTENRYARNLEKIVIAIGVGLGLLCLILLIIIIITCIRCRSRGSHNDTSDTETFSDKKVNDRMRNVKRTYSTTGELGLNSWENNAHIGAPPTAQHLRTTQFEMTENGSKQSLLSGGKTYAATVISPIDMQVSSATLQRVSGHYDAYNSYDYYDGPNTFAHHSPHLPDDNDSGSYVDDFDSDSHHSSYQLPPEGYRDPPDQPDINYEVPEVVYSQIGRREMDSAYQEALYSPRHADTPSNYGSNGAGAAPVGGGSIGVENPSYAASPSDGGANKLDSQYF